MKHLTCLIFILLSSLSYSQKSILTADSLGKYSYTILGIRKSYVNVKEIEMGTCFFIKENRNLFLITAKHVLYECDSQSNKVYTPYIMGLVNIPYSGDKLEFSIPLISDTCMSFAKDTDLVVIKMVDKWLDSFNSVESFIQPPIDHIGDLEIFGQGMENHSGFIAITNPHHVHVPTGEFTAYTTTPVPDSNYIDSVHYCFITKKLGIGYWLKGYSGSPVFLQDKKTERWRFCGVLTGGLLQISKKHKGGFVIVKPEYILNRINLLSK